MVTNNEDNKNNNEDDDNNEDDNNKNSKDNINSERSNEENNSKGKNKNTNNNKAVCQYCNTKFKNNFNRLRHEKTVHEKKKQDRHPAPIVINSPIVTRRHERIQNPQSGPLTSGVVGSEH